jgi:low temperature requirement protein LtrA
MVEPTRAPDRHGAAAFVYARMTARSPHESHRTATPLELFFDLVFVVAIAQAASGLHHDITEAHVLHGLMSFLMVFFAIWWAWMNFTWFASAYDCDDVPYRLAVFVQIGGALILAAGVPRMFEEGVPNGAVLGGYVVMRLALVAQWLRASSSDPAHRTTAKRYALGIALLQVAWVSLPLVPHLWIPGFLTLVALELAMPLWAEHASATTWHPQHIAERYGLLTLIVLGESVLAATVAIQSALASGEALSSLAPIIVGGFLIICSMWWVYFDRPVDDLLTSLRRAFVWGYGHYVVFVSAAAVGAGLAVNVDYATGHAKIGGVAAGASVAIPVATFHLCLWFLHHRREYERTRTLSLLAILVILLTPFTGEPVLFTGIVFASLVAAKVVMLRR